MGRVKIPLKKIENKTYKHITFSKRKNGIVKKAYELSVLCDVEIALVVFSPAGKLIIFDGKKRLEDIFQSFLDLPEHKRDCIQNQELVRRIITEMRLESVIYHQFNPGNNSEGCIVSLESQLNEIEEEINRCRIQLEEVEKQLQCFVKSPNYIKSIQEADHYENILEDTLARVRSQKQYLEASENIGNVNGAFDWTNAPIMNPTNSEFAFRTFSEIFQTPSEHVMLQTGHGDAGGLF